MERLSTLVRAQKERLKEVLLVALPTAITNVNDIGTLLSPPAEEDIWIVTGVAIESVFQYRNQALIISEASPTSYTGNLTGTIDRASKLVTKDYQISFLFKLPASFEPITRQGRQLRQVELVDLMSDRYKAAIIEVLLEESVDGSSILECSIVSDWADQVEIDSIGSFGRATIALQIKSQGEVPTPKYRVETIV